MIQQFIQNKTKTSKIPPGYHQRHSSYLTEKDLNEHSDYIAQKILQASNPTVPKPFGCKKNTYVNFTRMQL